jgi:two-component system, NtrC family, response regulator GlrR
MKIPSLLIIDDDKDVCCLFENEFKKAGFHAEAVNSLSQAYPLLRAQTFDLILLDLCLGNINALDHMQSLLKESPLSRIWVLTAHGSIETAVQAMRAGASGFFPKDKNSQSIVNELKAAYLSTIPIPQANVAMEGVGLLGKSPSIQLVLQNIDRMKEVDSTVLICGESGTGKELIAKALHLHSARKSYPFVAINCGAIPENLLESELFGHKKGSFTDAKTDRKGYFEQCSHGTLLLDEIGEMPLSLQVKLLRVLQEKEVYPVGASQAVVVNTRVLASTNRCLEDEVRAGRFREDLFYRLSVLRIDTPSLRERKEDIPLLVQSFVEKYIQQFKKPIRLPSQELLARLVAYDWPGNVRELQNAIERAVVLSHDGYLHLEDIFQTAFEMSLSERRGGMESVEEGAPRPFIRAKEDFERKYLIRLLTATHGNVSEAARLSGQYRPHIYRLMDKYKIEVGDFKASAKI